MLTLIYGLVFLNARATASGALLAIGAKMWFVDRMVWLFEDIKHLYPNLAVAEKAPTSGQKVVEATESALGQDAGNPAP